MTHPEIVAELKASLKRQGIKLDGKPYHSTKGQKKKRETQTRAVPCNGGCGRRVWTEDEESAPKCKGCKGGKPHAVKVSPEMIQEMLNLRINAEWSAKRVGTFFGVSETTVCTLAPLPPEIREARKNDTSPYRGTTEEARKRQAQDRKNRRCPDCDCSMVDYSANAIRCTPCSNARRKQQDHDAKKAAACRRQASRVAASVASVAE